jgi:CheY-like chemotaxis protein
MEKGFSGRSGDPPRGSNEGRDNRPPRVYWLHPCRYGTIESPYPVPLGQLETRVELDGTDRALILVVERDPHVRELEQYFLEEAGYVVEFASDGLAALEQARTLQPQILITEVLVPRLDGLALCRKIKADPATSHMAVLIFSILLAEGRAREAGADGFLRKPLAERRLVETVRELLASREAPSSERSGG